MMRVDDPAGECVTWEKQQATNYNDELDAIGILMQTMV
jgi:hypothetical protein